MFIHIDKDSYNISFETTKSVVDEITSYYDERISKGEINLTLDEFISAMLIDYILIHEGSTTTDPQ